MERLGRTNAELAAASGLGKSTLSRYRRGEREPRWGSPQLWQLAKGLTALGGGDDAELDALHTALGECLSTGLRLDHATYICRILAGTRRPGDAAGFTAQVSAYAARLAFSPDRRKELQALLNCSPAVLETREKGMSAIRRWLSEY